MTDVAPSQLPDCPPFVQGWIRQLLEPRMLATLRDAGEGQIEVRLIASGGRVRRRPTILLDAGGHPMIDPAEVA